MVYIHHSRIYIPPISLFPEQRGLKRKFFFPVPTVEGIPLNGYENTVLNMFPRVKQMFGLKFVYM